MKSHVMLGFSAEPALHNAVRRLAERQGVSKAAVMRAAVTGYVAEQDAKTIERGLRGAGGKGAGAKLMKGQDGLTRSDLMVAKSILEGHRHDIVRILIEQVATCGGSWSEKTETMMRVASDCGLQIHSRIQEIQKRIDRIDQEQLR